MRWWFKKHPDKFQDECDRLERNSNYDEHSRVRNNILISQGEIIVRLEKTTRHAILIIYPESTPYSLPKVYPLTDLLTEEDLKNLAALSSFEAAKEISGKIEFFNFWHQNSDGSLCFLEAANLESFGEFFSITDIINRVREWLVSNETGKKMPEGPEVELFAHFKEVDRTREILIPEEIRSADLNQGELFAVQISHVYPSEVLIEKRIYLGVLLDGENAAGLRLPTIEFSKGFDFMPSGIKNSLDLTTKPALIDTQIEEKSLIKLFWWRINTFDRPIQDIYEFSVLLGKGDSERGFARIKKLISLNDLASAQEVLLAVQYANLRNEKKWQAFVLKKKEKASQFPILNSSHIRDYVNLFDNFEFLALRCTEFTDQRHHLRNSGVAKREILKDKEVTIIGCGALGGEVAGSIAKAGVSPITLVDNEGMEMDNSIRHLVGIDKMGYAKVHALYQHLFYYNPFITINPLLYDVLSHDLEKYLSTKGIGLSTIADDNTEGFINEQAVISNKIIFYARALRGGKAARIFRVIPGKDACFNCLSLYKNESNTEFTAIPEDPDLPIITNECNNPIRPSSASDLKLISSLFSGLILQHLQVGESNFNHWIWTTEQLDDNEHLNPMALTPSFLPPHPDCQYCNTNQKRINVEISKGILENMILQTRINPEIETGGVLVGHLNEKNKIVVIDKSSPPGPNAIKKPTEFLKDKKFCQGFVDEEFVRSNHRNVYVGEWRYHPSYNNAPSGTDLKSLNDIADGKNYLTENPLMIILNNEDEASCTVHPHGRSYYTTKLTIKDEN